MPDSRLLVESHPPRLTHSLSLREGKHAHNLYEAEEHTALKDQTVISSCTVDPDLALGKSHMVNTLCRSLLIGRVMQIRSDQLAIGQYPIYVCRSRGQSENRSDDQLPTEH